MTFEIIKNDDIQKISELFMNVFNLPPWNDNWTVELASKRIMLKVSNPNCRGLKSCENDIVYGFILGRYTGFPTGIGFFIDDLCVSDKKQNEGIGTRLLQAMETELRNEGIKLIITTTAKGFYSYNFYLKNEFIENKATVGLFKKLY